MQKNDKFYSFLLKHSYKNRVYIRRFEVSKSLVHFSSLGIFLAAGVAFLGLGLSGAISHYSTASAASSTSTLAVLSQPQNINDDIDYSRPGDSADVTVNSGGPELGDENDSENSEVDAQLRVASASMPDNLRPNMWPHTGKINNEFGFRRNPFGGRAYEFHPGMDIDGERGDIVNAPAGGTVIKAGWTGGYGNMIEIDHGNGITTRYGHLSKIEVSIGDTITRGQELGLIGSTGRSTGPHLHYEMRLNDRPINPRHFLPQEPITLN